MVHASPAWQQLGWWANWMSVAGFPIAIIGIWQAKRQAIRATAAAEAAELAVKSTETRLRSRVLLALLVPQLQWISNELDLAVDGDDAELVRRHLKNWRQHAGNVRGMLNVSDQEQSELAKVLQESITLARIAGTAITRSVGDPLVKHSTKARTSIGQACDELNVWVGKNVTRTGDPANE